MSENSALKVTVVASTKPGFCLTLQEAKISAGQSAGICYMKDSFETILREPLQDTIKRVQSTIDNGHHSVYDHINYTLLLDGIPKILAMLLNNEGFYSTSEKSARFTKMALSGKEAKLYLKWLDIFKNLIAENTNTDPSKIEKMAQENARYLTSVFTPTTMQYTTSIKQLNYLICRIKKFIKRSDSALLGNCDIFYDMMFFVKLKPYLLDLVEKLEFLIIPGLDNEPKERQLQLSLFTDRGTYDEYFGEVYCTSYSGSFAQLAQAHRHRTLRYNMLVCEDCPRFYTPIIIRDDEQLTRMWLHDIGSVAKNYPQGMMVEITERGTYEDFLLKVQDRLCSQAQLEISLQTYSTLQKYMNSVYDRCDVVYETLSDYDQPARCGWGWKCKKRCSWGVHQLERLV